MTCRDTLRRHRDGPQCGPLRPVAMVSLVLGYLILALPDAEAAQLVQARTVPNPTHPESYNERAVVLMGAGHFLAAGRPEQVLVMAGAYDALETRRDVLQGKIAALRAAVLFGIQDVLNITVFAEAAYFLPAWQSDDSPAAVPNDPRADRSQLNGVEDRAPLPSIRQNRNEYHAYCYLVSLANRVPCDQLARHARRDITFRHMFSEPDTYRGEIVGIEGRLRRVSRLDAPIRLQADGINAVYECWIFPEASHPNPVCVIVSELPDGVDVAEQLDMPVILHGYFFKRYRYQAVDAVRDAPLLVGRSFSVREIEAEAPAGPLLTLDPIYVYWVLAIGSTILLLGVGLTMALRWNNQRVQARLRQVRMTGLHDPGREVLHPEIQFHSSSEAETKHGHSKEP